MKYKNRLTGEVYLHLAYAFHLDGASPVQVVLFCPDDNDNIIYSMPTERFEREFKTVCERCDDTGLIDGEICAYCAEFGIGAESKKYSRVA